MSAPTDDSDLLPAYQRMVVDRAVFLLALSEVSMAALTHGQHVRTYPRGQLIEAEGDLAAIEALGEHLARIATALEQWKASAQETQDQQLAKHMGDHA